MLRLLFTRGGINGGYRCASTLELKMTQARHWKTLAQAALLLSICIFFSVLHWGKMSSLWGDQARWLFEAYRAASGEVVYRDFMWQFPPLSLWLMSAAFQLFGGTFEVALIVLDVLGLCLVGLMWLIARRLVSSWLAWVTVIAFTCAVGFEGGPNFTFFSLNIYTPAQLTGLIGLLLLVWSIIAYLQTGVLSRQRWLTIGLGSTIGLLSKPEFAVGSIAGLIALMLIDRRGGFRTKPIGDWLRYYAGVISIGLLPALSTYLIIGSQVGAGNLVAGLSGYGAAAFVCPWWPTGISLFGIAAALGRGALMLAVLTFSKRTILLRKYRWRYFALWIGGGLGLVLTVIYLPVSLNMNGYSSITMIVIVDYAFGLGTALTTVLWASVIGWVILIVRALRGTSLSDRSRLLIVLWSIALALSARGLFGDVNAVTPLVALASFPLWTILAVTMLLDALNRLMPNGSAAESRITFGLLIVFGAIRFGLGIHAAQGQVYSLLSTEAGTIALADNQSAAVYQYVVSHTIDHEAILDLDYGGGINFAARRGSPVYSTQFIYLAPDQKYRIADFDRISRQPPALIIANDQPNFNVTFGVLAPTRCTFPRLVWRPDQLAYDPAEVFPVVDYIQSHYVPVAQFGDIVIYRLQNS